MKSSIQLPLTTAEQFSSFVYITNDNPRTENEDSIIEDIKKGFSGNDYFVIKNRKEALETIFKKYKNKIIVILGKGRDDYHIVGDKKQYHSDIEIVQKFLDAN